MRNTGLGEGTSPIRCSAMPKIICVARNTALPASYVAGIAHIDDKMKHLSSKTKLIVITKNENL